MVESLFFRLFTFLLIFIDVSVVIADLVQNPTGKSEITDLQKVDLIITVWFVVELILRYVSSFFRKKNEMPPRETLQNLSYFWNTKTASLIFINVLFDYFSPELLP